MVVVSHASFRERDIDHKPADPGPAAETWLSKRQSPALRIRKGSRYFQEGMYNYAFIMDPGRVD
jgi:hypothetical protein